MVINMEENKKTVEQSKHDKPTYEELNNYCNQLFMQNKELYQKLGTLVNVYTRLPYLFKVLEYSTYFSEDFTKQMANEIQGILEIPEDTTEESKETVKD